MRFLSKWLLYLLIELFYIGMSVVRTDGRAGGRSVYGHVITKFSRMGSLPHFFTHGAPLRASRARAPLLIDWLPLLMLSTDFKVRPALYSIINSTTGIIERFHITSRRELPVGAASGSWGPFLESAGNFSGPK